MLTSRLRPMAVPGVLTRCTETAIKNTWTVEEVDFSTDVDGPAQQDDGAERHLINRLVAFFATGDSIVVEQPRAESLQAHQRARSADVPVAAALSKRRCTCSST